MSAADSVRPSRPHRPGRLVISLLALAALAGAAACNDESFRPGPSGPTPPSTIVFQTAPIEGVVREVGGGPLAGQTVTLWGVTTNPTGVTNATTTTDGSGRFRLDGFPSTPNQFPHITTAKSGYVPVNWPVPKGIERPAPVSVNLSLQPFMILTEGEPLHTTLSNDDTDYGWPDGPSWNLPVARGPVKVVGITTTSRGPHILRAEWSSADRLSLWAEVYYKEVNIEAIGTGGAELLLPIDWTIDRANPITVTVGLPRTARASGGLPGSINLTLSLTPKYPAP